MVNVSAPEAPETSEKTGIAQLQLLTGCNSTSLSRDREKGRTLFRTRELRFHFGAPEIAAEAAFQRGIACGLSVST
jgi:hypothetical protein